MKIYNGNSEFIDEDDDFEIGDKVETEFGEGIIVNIWYNEDNEMMLDLILN